MAISFDTSLHNAATTSFTYTPGTLTNGAIVLRLYPNTGGATVTSTPTYGGNSMTLIDSATGTSTKVYMYVITSPPAGAQTVTWSMSAGNADASIASYNGVNQASPIDSHANAALGASTASPVNLTTTVVGTNCWLVGGTNETSVLPSAGVKTVKRQTDYFDSNATVGVGSQSLQVTFTGTQAISYVVASLAPSTSSTVAFDNSATSTATGSPTISYTVTGSNPLLIVAIANWAPASGADLITGVTYNGVSMTRNSTMSGTIENGNTPKGFLSFYYIVGQSGTHNVIISTSGAGISASSGIILISYSGVDQTTPINVSGRTASSSNLTSTSVTINIPDANSWLGSILTDGNGSGEAVVSPLTNIRVSPQTYINFGDSGGTVASGNETAQWNYNSAPSTVVGFGIKPAVATVANSGFFFATSR